MSDIRETPFERDRRYLESARAMTLRALIGLPVDVYLFGSRARGDARPTSDIDVAIDPHGDVPRRVVSELREAFEESHIPLRVDVIDLRDATVEFRERVRREGQRWSA